MPWIAFAGRCDRPWRRRAAGPVARELARVPLALVARGERDEWQTAAKLQADEVRLRAAGVNVSSLQFDGGHEWTPDFSRAAGDFLQRFD